MKHVSDAVVQLICILFIIIGCSGQGSEFIGAIIKRIDPQPCICECTL